MFNPRLIAVVTALTLMAGTSARAEYTLDHLLQIEGYITAKNCAGLWNFVQSNPEVTRGNDPLANELRVFVSATERGQLDCFSARSASAPNFGNLEDEVIAPEAPTVTPPVASLTSPVPTATPPAPPLTSPVPTVTPPAPLPY